jgi:type I restriction enzyme S subunit
MAWEGGLGVVPPECDGLYVSLEYPVFEVNTARVLPEVLDIYFRTPAIWPMISEISTGTNARRKRMHPSVFLAYEFPLPPMETQMRLQGIKKRVDELRQRHREQRRELKALMPSVLAKAFAGEL